VADDGLTIGKIYKFKFQATNKDSRVSEYSDIARYALVDTPAAPDAPTVIYSMTNESQIAIEWSKVTLDAGQEIGQEIEGYFVEVLEMNKAIGSEASSATEGKFVVFYNGTSSPETTQILVKSINGEALKPGFEYIFRVTAKYLNGHTAASAELSTWACSSPTLAPGIEW